MSLAQGNNTPTRPRIEPGSPDPESDALRFFAVVSLNLCNVLISNRSSGKQQSLVSYIPYKYGYVHGMHCKVYEASDMHFRVFGGKD